MRSRWLRFILAIVTGIGLGLLVGWLISPVKYVNTTPDSLGGDYKTDYVLMVAEVYQAEGNLTLAAQRLALLGKQPPLQTVQQALAYAIGSNYPAGDVTLLSQLVQAFQAGASPTPKNGVRSATPGGS
jgi:hypothetical protein